MLWTVFKVLMIVWMLQTVLRFGGSALGIVLVGSLAALVLRMSIPRASFSSSVHASSGRLRGAINMRHH